jgi:cation diffusion facilitator CzcD-associated flavoprotein CzcO
MPMLAGRGTRIDIQAAHVVRRPIEVLLLQGDTYLQKNLDVPSHTYQADFEPNVEWSHFYASGKEILQYWKKVAKKYGCMKYIKLKHKVVEACWSDERAKWDLKVQNEDGSVFSDSCSVLISSSGSLNNWKWPDIPGLHDFQGKLLHTAAWDEGYDHKVSTYYIMRYVQI